MVNKLAETDDILKRAFHLAYFIHGDKACAMRVVMGALTRLEVATAAQNKRRYYTPQGRSSSIHRPAAESFRNKIAFSKPHLLQRLIYVESEAYEVQKEQANGTGTLSTEDMLVHFIKHLVRISIRRNSFYVTLGINRLLYNFSTAETMEIYNLIVQDPERVKDDYYYRSRKGVLLHELKQRFGHLLKTYRGPRGEERLHTMNDPSQYAVLVRKCLALFTPWSTSCLLPPNFDPLSESLAFLTYQGQQAEDAVEINRIHAVLHPDCLQRIIEALGVGSTGERLTVPHFFHTHDEGDQNGPKRNGQPPPQLNDEDLRAIKNTLSEQAERRQKTPADLLRIVVDGAERARLNLKRESSIRFQLEENPELIEVMTNDSAGELHLASHLLTYDDAASPIQPLRTAIVLEGKQKISINIFFKQNADGETEGGQVEIKYQERSLLRAVALFARQLKNKLPDNATHQGGGKANILKPVALLSLLIICLAGAVWYVNKQRATVESPLIQINRGVAAVTRAEKEAGAPTLAGTETPGKQTATPPSQQEQQQGVPPPFAQKRKEPQPHDEPRNQSQPNIARPRRERNPSGPSNARNPQPERREPSNPENEWSRGLENESAVTSLLDVRKVYLEITGGSSAEAEIRPALIEQLGKSSYFGLIENRDDADAVLKVTVREMSGAASDRKESSNQAGTMAAGSAPRAEVAVKRYAITARLVNARGEVLWPATKRSAQFEGDAATSAARMVEALLGDIRRIKREP